MARGVIRFALTDFHLLALTLTLSRSDDKFRASFLWGRKPMLAACAARLASRSNMVWVDLGGGTGVSRCDQDEIML